ncbi:YqaJ viral recombinase family protein [bacterium]|nr:YqaJ viral recombinase family protein [bacterium]
MFTTEERRNYIGGSDISAVMGMNRWKTQLKLWLEKTGDAELADLSQNEAVQLGTELEEFVAQKFAKITGKSVRKQSKMYVHKEYPYMVAHVDRLITGTDELLECKTCGSYKKDEWEGDEIPQEYILQVNWYLGITGRKRGYIAVLIGGQQFKYKVIDFDVELFSIMVDMAKDFWNCVKTNTPPAITPSDNELILKIFPNHTEDFIQNQEIEDRVDYLQQIKSDITALKEEQQMLEAELKNIINTHIGILTDKYKITWKEQTSSKLNVDRLKADELYDKYADKVATRVLRISKIKQAA